MTPTRRPLIATVAGLCLTAALLVGSPADAAPNTWSSAAPMPTGLTKLAVVANSDGKIYAFGGGSNGVSAIARVFDPVTNAWTAIGNMTNLRQDGAAAASGGRVYALGGGSGIEEYNPATNSWAGKSIPPAGHRYWPAAASLSDGRILLIGGRGGGSPSSYIPTSSLESYSPANDSWTTLAPMPTGRWAHAAATATDGKVYVFGGNSNADQNIAAVHAYNPADNTWAVKAPMPTPRASLAAVLGSDGRIYTIGGHNGSSTALVEAYDPSTDTWSTAAPMPAARHNLGAARGSDGRIYAVGGETSPSTAGQATNAAYEAGPSSPPPTTDSKSQATSVTVSAATPPAGTLSVTLAANAVGFGTVTAGSSSSASPIGQITHTNTLASGTNWSTTVAATSLRSGSSIIPFSGLTFAPGSSIAAAGGATGSAPGAGTAGAFSGTDTTPGTTFSSPRTVLSAAAATQGTYNQTGSTATLAVPSSASATAHTGTLQYTITG